MRRGRVRRCRTKSAKQMAWLGGAEDGEHFVGGLGVFELSAPVFVAEEPGEGGKGLEMLLKLTLRSEEENAEADRLVVERLEIHRGFEVGDDGDRRLNAGNAGMRNGQAETDAGAVAGLAIFNGFDDAGAVFGADFTEADELVNQCINHAPTVRGGHFRSELFKTKHICEIYHR